MNREIKSLLFVRGVSITCMILERCKHHLHDPEMEIQYLFVQKSRF